MRAPPDINGEIESAGIGERRDRGVTDKREGERGERASTHQPTDLCVRVEAVKAQRLARILAEERVVCAFGKKSSSVQRETHSSRRAAFVLVWVLAAGAVVGHPSRGRELVGGNAGRSHVCSAFLGKPFGAVAVCF